MDICVFEMLVLQKILEDNDSNFDKEIISSRLWEIAMNADIFDDSRKDIEIVHYCRN
jgi:hypothetical protein